jgi:hypothetical protein
VLFVSDDNITAPLDTNYIQDRYRWYLEWTERLTAPDGQPTDKQPLLAPGPVVQPNHLQSFYEHPWKLARYWEPGNPTNTQWELYNIDADINENHNLVGWDKETGAPVIRPEAAAIVGLSVSEVEEALERLRGELNRALIRAGYTPQNVQTLGVVADGQPPETE